LGIINTINNKNWYYKYHLLLGSIQNYGKPLYYPNKYEKKQKIFFWDEWKYRKPCNRLGTVNEQKRHEKI